MKNKTCGECKNFVQSEYLDVCTVFSEVYKPDSSGEKCDYFEPKITTNGDVIRQMSNEELVDFIREVTDDRICDYCVERNKICEFRSGEDICTKGMIAWLNAPAESEGER